MKLLKDEELIPSSVFLLFSCSQNITGKGVVVEATKLEQINTSLEKGPVLVIPDDLIQMIK